ncbi:MAG: MFS transporter [Propionibacteriaceae bacterium]|nr:MFS transporter [Propionibacteriaceae bacterium]
MVTQGAAQDRLGGFDRRLFAPMVLGSVLNPINSSVIAVALVPIAIAFGAPAAQTTWLVSALYITTCVGQPLMGRLIDLFGPRRLYLIGTALTGVAGVLGLVASGLHILVLARVILGFGTCAGYPAAMYLIRAEAKRTGMKSPAVVLTTLAVANQTVMVIGPALGGLLILWGGWRATFVINIPLALACVIMGWLILPRHTALDADRRAETSPHIDYAGIVLFVVTLVSLLIFLMDLKVSYTWLLGVSVVAGTGFAWWELRQTNNDKPPFIELRVLAGNPALVITYVRAMLGSTVSYSFMYGFTQWLEDGRGLDPSHAGFLLLPAFAVGILVALITGRNPQIRAKLMVGSCAQAAACALILLVGDHSPIWLLLGVALLMGVPQGLNSLAMQNSVYHQADPTRIGASSGLMRTFNYLGAIIASVASGLFFPVRATTAGVHGLALVAVGCAVIFLVITIVDPSLSRVDRAVREEGSSTDN